MSAFEEKADGAVSLTIARGCNSLWMRPDRQITYTLRQNADGSWAILRAGWAGGHKTPEYQIWGTSVRLGNSRPLPDTLPLVGESGLTWQQAADRFDMTVEELQTLNPDVRVREDGVILDRLLLDPAYALPDPNAQRAVRILLPWETYQGTHTYTLPDGLDEQAYIVAAESPGLSLALQRQDRLYPSRTGGRRAGRTLPGGRRGALHPVQRTEGTSRIRLYAGTGRKLCIRRL